MPKRRLQIELSESDCEILKEVRKSLDSTTDVQALRSCLRIVRSLVDCSKGGAVRVIDPKAAEQIAVIMLM